MLVNNAVQFIFGHLMPPNSGSGIVLFVRYIVLSDDNDSLQHALRPWNRSQCDERGMAAGF